MEDCGEVLMHIRATTPRLSAITQRFIEIRLSSLQEGVDWHRKIARSLL
jgi:hypothetical protein